MSATDKDIHPQAAFARRYLQFHTSVPINSAGTFWDVFPYLQFPALPPLGLIWYIENVQIFCTAVTATASVVLRRVGGGDINLIASTTPVAATIVNAPITAPLASRQMVVGTHRLNPQCTTNGTGTITNLVMTVTIRPFPLGNEAI